MSYVTQTTPILPYHPKTNMAYSLQNNLSCILLISTDQSENQIRKVQFDQFSRYMYNREFRHASHPFQGHL